LQATVFVAVAIQCMLVLS